MFPACTGGGSGRFVKVHTDATFEANSHVVGLHVHAARRHTPFICISCWVMCRGNNLLALSGNPMVKLTCPVLNRNAPIRSLFMKRLQFLASDVSTLRDHPMFHRSYLPVSLSSLSYPFLHSSSRVPVLVCSVIHSGDVPGKLWERRLDVLLDGALLVAGHNPDSVSLSLRDPLYPTCRFNVICRHFQIVHAEEDFDAITHSILMVLMRRSIIRTNTSGENASPWMTPFVR